MEWIESIRQAIIFIEDNITEDLTIEEIAGEAFISTFYFQKGFAMLCGFTVSEYIRQRRLTLAGTELVSSDEKIIDIAISMAMNLLTASRRHSPASMASHLLRFERMEQ